jgi:micrococcal nuclease
LKIIPLIISVIFLISASELLTGEVVGVSDGDTFTLLQGKEQIKIRLYGIDCPERNQAFGNKAKTFLSSKIYRKWVEVIALDKDQYGRIVGDVKIDGVNINYELVKNGYAWWYRKYAPNDDSLRIFEETARVSHIGLWSDTNPIEPWGFRKNQKR